MFAFQHIKRNIIGKYPAFLGLFVWIFLSFPETNDGKKSNGWIF